MQTAPNSQHLPPAALVTYSELLDGLFARFDYSPLVEAEAEARALPLLRDAYEQCLLAAAWRLPTHPITVPTSGDYVLRSAFAPARKVDFYAADPTTDPDLLPLTLGEESPQGLQLVPLEGGSIPSNVYARAAFPPLWTTLEVVGGTTYAQWSRVFDPSTGHCFICIASAGALGSTLTDATKWAPLPVLAILTGPVQLYALADWMQSTDADYAASLRTEADKRLNKLATQAI